MLNRVLFIVTIVICSLQPIIVSRPAVAREPSQVEWPTHFQGVPLTKQPLSALDSQWAKNFPGAIGIFRAANSQLVFRYVSRPTRSLHPSRDCMQAAGFTVTALPIRVDREGARWSCISAIKAEERLTSCERIFDSNGESFSDVSAWYWHALLGKSTGPWWAVTVIE